MPSAIYTIGHSNHTWDTFLPLLRLHGIEAVVDVRSRPISRFAPFANKNQLPQLLAAEGIGHAWMGEGLGGKPDDPDLTDDYGSPDYARIAASPAFVNGIDELMSLAESVTVALMCAEADPTACHRALLLAPALAACGAQVAHIRKSGAAEMAF